ncbi:MAG: YaiO family outer membrane beta-barrel protein [Gemmatimonadaceae bacterium]|nr:YaiO family outer membrane beta-barrel protein [Gemmatimonadaceae bacterium]
MTSRRGRRTERPRPEPPRTEPPRTAAMRRLAARAFAALLAAVMGAATLPVSRAHAQERASAHDGARPLLDRRVDLFADRHQVTGGYGDWRGVGLRLSVPVGQRDTWFAEALERRAFRDEGTYLSVANQHVWSERVYTYASVGGGSGDFVLPDLRLDASLSTKWGARRALVTTLGTTLIDAKRGYRDVGGFAALTGYLSPWAVAEGGVRVTRSTPGDVDAARGNGALTLGSQGHTVVVVRGSSGREGYQLLGAGAAVRRFSSQEGSASVRQWVGAHGGVLVQGEHYRNPFYRRTGVTLGVFAHW